MSPNEVSCSGTGSRSQRPGEGASSERRSLDRIFLMLTTSFGLASLPIAPGTWGSLPGVAIYWLVALTAPVPYHTALLAAATVAVSAGSVALGPWAENYWKRKDPKKFVPDEVAGFLVTVTLFRTPDLVLTTVWAFVVTRIADIIKPPPARQLERLSGGWGILLDDVVASLYAALFLNVLASQIPQFFGGRPFLANLW
jgi:phosphatidylglycerophosphatase A